MKIEPQTSTQINFIFSQPLSFLSCATIQYQRVIPPGFGTLNISPNRGGNATLIEITISRWSEENKRVLGIRVWDSRENIKKEDHYEYDRLQSVVRKYPKGEYQQINPLYANTHYTN